MAFSQDSVKAVVRGLRKALKLATFIVGALFLAAMAHEAVHLVQLAANSSVVEPTALVINLIPNGTNASFAEVRWTWKEGATEKQALAFMGGIWKWEALAYLVFFAVLGAIIWAARDVLGPGNHARAVA